MLTEKKRKVLFERFMFTDKEGLSPIYGKFIKRDKVSLKETQKTSEDIEDNFIMFNGWKFKGKNNPMVNHFVNLLKTVDMNQVIMNDENVSLFRSGLMALEVDDVIQHAYANDLHELGKAIQSNNGAWFGLTMIRLRRIYG